MLRKKSKFLIVLSFLCFGIGYVPLQAASVAPGGSFTVSISCGNVEGTVNATGDNASISSAGSWCDRGASVEVTAVAGSAGTATISLIGSDATGDANTANPVPYNGKVIGSTSIQVVAPTTTPTPSTPQPQPKPQPKPKETEKPKNEEKKSADNTLASLSVSKGTLSPKFSADVNAYEVNLSSDSTRIDVSAKAKDVKATVRGIGKHSLKAGKNSIVISVTAENGNVKNYTIQVNVDTKPSLYVDYNGMKLGVVSNLHDVDGPNKSFEKTKVKIDGKDVVAWKNNLLGKTVVYLINDKTGEKNYYVYNASTNKIETMLKPVAVLGHNFYIVDIDKNMQNKEGMTFGTVSIDKHDFPGWTFKDAAFKNYAVIYVMNEKGEMAYYQYESSEKTLQLYAETAPYTLKEYNDTKKSLTKSIEKRDIIIAVLSVLCIILFIFALYFFIRKKKRMKYPKMDIQNKKIDHGFHMEAQALTQEDEKE